MHLRLIRSRGASLAARARLSLSTITLATPSGRSDLCDQLSPEKIVAELDRHIVGQNKAKRCVAIALRERWRRKQLKPEMQEEIHPSNILMIGPTGSGKTETARRLSNLVGAPFVKVEATRYTEVGIYGTDTEEMIRDLVDAAIRLHRSRKEKEIFEEVVAAVDETIVTALYNAGVEPDREFVVKRYKAGELEQEMITVTLSPKEFRESSSNPLEAIIKAIKPISQSSHMSKALSTTVEIVEAVDPAPRPQPQQMTVAQARRALFDRESSARIDQDSLVCEAIKDAEQNGIVFIDEVDKVAQSAETDHHRTAKGEGVQKELLPIIEGTTIRTTYGPVNTDHILFIASGAFSKSKPSDLLPELQGRLPIRVKLDALSKDDFYRILTETEFNLLEQQIALLETEGVKLLFTDDGIEEIASICLEMNRSVENIGARRLRTVLAKVLEDISFRASTEMKSFTVDRKHVRNSMKDEFDLSDLGRFVL